MSYSLPTSPAMTRSNKGQPVTPQRLPRQQPRSQSLYRSPLTPSTSPYTPLSLRSADSTDSSILTTPDNASLNIRKRLVYSSVSVDHGRQSSAAKDKSLADIAENWRSRANENGIKVSLGKPEEASHITEDSGDLSMSDAGNTSTILSSDEMLAAPFMSAHRRLNSLPAGNRPRAVSHASFHAMRPQPSSPLLSRSVHAAASSPQQRRSSASLSQNVLSTPPPNRALTRQLKLKGSLTDPPRPRRREAFGALPTQPHNMGRNSSMSFAHEGNTSLDLFDISEDDVEYENESFDSSPFLGGQLPERRSPGYPNFVQHHEQPLFPNPTNFADPFHGFAGIGGMPTNHMLPSISENAEHQFHAGRQLMRQPPYFEDGHFAPEFYSTRPVSSQYNHLMPVSYPAFVPMPSAPLMSFNSSTPQLQPTSFNPAFPPTMKTPTSVEKPSLPPSDCSVCLIPNPSTLAILQPCSHPLCSSCLTSALNIVGEKDMACAVCKQSVADFKLLPAGSRADGSSPTSELSSSKGPADLKPGPTSDSISSTPTNVSGGFDSVGDASLEELQSAFDFGLDFGVMRASTPKLERQSLDPIRDPLSSSTTSSRSAKQTDSNVVLRIDNVPWDITPLQIKRWLQHPVERVHVLLDPKGKTLSHAYVEVKDASIAGAILRGEVSSANGRKERGSVLGRGRRARGVTITRSGQQELMKDLFPQWRGGFVGARPVLSSVQGERALSGPDSGILTESEIMGLVRLIREPDSHFLKVPVLPFHSLISILTKFPVDVDSRIFWSTNVRDALFDATYTAIQLLIPRVEKAKDLGATRPDEEHTLDLVIDLVKVAMDCRAFTDVQVHRLAALAEAQSLPVLDLDLSRVSDRTDNTSGTLSTLLHTPGKDQVSFDARTAIGPQIQDTSNTSLDDLAKEFGVETHLIQALAQRLAKLS